MDYAELAKRLRVAADFWRKLPDGYCRCENLDDRGFPDGTCDFCLGDDRIREAADAIEALTSPPDEAQVDAALKVFVCTERIMFRVDPGSMALALNAAYRIRVKGTT